MVHRSKFYFILAVLGTWLFSSLYLSSQAFSQNAQATELLPLKPILKRLAFDKINPKASENSTSYWTLGNPTSVAGIVYFLFIQYTPSKLTNSKRINSAYLISYIPGIQDEHGLGQITVTFLQKKDEILNNDNTLQHVELEPITNQSFIFSATKSVLEKQDYNQNISLVLTWPQSGATDNLHPRFRIITTHSRVETSSMQAFPKFIIDSQWPDFESAASTSENLDLLQSRMKKATQKAEELALQREKNALKELDSPAKKSPPVEEIEEDLEPLLPSAIPSLIL